MCEKDGPFMKYILLLGRILFAAIFIVASMGHFSQEKIQYAASMGVLFPSVFVPLSGIIALIGGLSILLGYKARWGAWLLVIFLIPVTLMMHNFWAVSDPMAAAMQQAHFLKNISMLGGALIIAYFGSGPLSLSNHN